MRARDLCRKVGDPPQTFDVLIGMWNFHLAGGDIDAARNVAEEWPRSGPRRWRAAAPDGGAQRAGTDPGPIGVFQTLHRIIWRKRSRSMSLKRIDLYTSYTGRILL